MRKPKLRKKKVKGNVYWYTDANGAAYFGKVGEVPYDDARRLFAEHIREKPAARVADAVTVGGLFSAFLAWVQANRSEPNYRRRRTDCSRFARFVYEGRRLADVPALEATGAMLEAWRDVLRGRPTPGAACVNDRDRRGLDPQSLLHAETSVRHAFNWAARHNSPNTLVPSTFRPFAGVERTKVPSKALTEADLLSELEAAALLDSAAFDVDQFRRWGVEKHIARHGGAGLRASKDTFGEMLRIYHATGARTSELAVARVRDFSPRTGQIVLREHKRSKTQAVASVRHITLDGEALETMKRLCGGRPPDEFVFLRPWGKPWTKKTLNVRLRTVRRIAVACGAAVREGVSVYDFRHLWISEALMAGVDVMTVARMAGTSVRMVETVYGHFRTDHFAEAQRKLDEARRARLAAARESAAATPGRGGRSGEPPRPGEPASSPAPRRGGRRGGTPNA